MAKLQYSDKPMHSEHRRADERYAHKDLATQCLHAGERWEKQYYWTSSTPIYNSTTYFYDSAQDLDDRVYYRKPGYVYARGGTPTHTALERALSTLEGAEVTQACSSGMAASHLARVIVDNTFTTPYLLKPFEIGADFVSHSVTKFLSGHGDVLAGSVSCRRADFDRLHDMLIQVGCTLGPNEAWLALRGLKTFSLRMERHCANAMQVAQFLENHPLIEKVRYAGLPSHPQHETARRMFPDGRYGAMLNFDVAACDKDMAFRFLDALKLILPATTLGDIYSLIVNPARTTHHWLSEQELAAIGISPGTFRMSVGIENVEDLKGDLDQALKTCQV